MSTLDETDVRILELLVADGRREVTREVHGRIDRGLLDGGVVGRARQIPVQVVQKRDGGPEAHRVDGHRVGEGGVEVVGRKRRPRGFAGQQLPAQIDVSPADQTHPRHIGRQSGTR
mgnify:CR=1 FL=1